MNDPLERELIVFGTVRRLPAPERAAYLDETCAGDTALRKRIEELLRAGDEAGAFLLEPAPGAQRRQSPAAASTSDPCMAAPGERADDRIGRYKLLQQIGEGGCGVVYMAEQQEPVRRRVALKVIKLGMDTKQVIARFEAERQALAMMDHANIAKVLDAGTTETGRPYFVMELVRGIKITDYCDEHSLSTNERLELFMQVCQAVQHAHQKGIIHRDLKPSNILVASDDGVPVSKVIDFGIAKATQGRLTDQTLFTAFEQFIGTPAYMSPEQTELTMRDVDTRTDIYSLGVLLYELLTGRTPFDAQQLLASGLDEMRRTIREQEPERPSTRLSTMLEGELKTTARQRHTEAPRLVHLVRGDLDWIVMKCLEKARTRRYETANGLARDVQRHLKCEPVVARPPSRLYEFQKTIRRHKVGFAATAALILVLAAGVVVSKSEAIRATRAEHQQAQLTRRAEAGEEKALSEAVRSQQVADFLKDMLQGIGPSVALGRDTVLLREILDKTAERVGRDLKDQPQVEAELRFTIGEVYWALEEHDRAEEMHRKALALRRKTFGNDHPLVAASLNRLAWVLYSQGKMEEAERLSLEALGMRRRLLGEQHPDLASSLNTLAQVLAAEGKMEQAEPLQRQALDMYRKLFGDNYPEVPVLLNNLARIQLRRGKPAEAEGISREALAIRRRLYGNEHLEVAISLNDLGQILYGGHKQAEGEALMREALEMRRRLVGEADKGVTRWLSELASNLAEAGRLDQVEVLYRDALIRQRSALGPYNTTVVNTLCKMSRFLASRDKSDEATKLYREALEVIPRLAAEPAAQAYLELSRMDADRKDWQSAVHHLDEAIALSRDQRPATRKAVAEASVELARRAENAQPEIAEHWNQKAVDSFRQLAKDDPNDNSVRADLANALHLLTTIFFSEQKWAKAEEACLEAISRLNQLAQAAPARLDYAEACAHSHWQLGNVLAQTGRAGAAEAALRATLTIIEKGRQDFPDSTYFHQESRFIRQLLGDMLSQLGRVDEAVASHREAIGLFKQLAQADPKRGDYVIDLGNSYWRLAEVLAKAGRLAEAETVCRQGLQDCEKANRKFPNNLDLRNQQAAGCHWLGDVLSQAGRWDEAEPQYRAAMAGWAALKSQVPTNAFYSQEEAFFCWRLAQTLQKAGRIDAAEAEYNRAVSLHRKWFELFPASQKLAQARLNSVRIDFASLLRSQGKDAQATTMESEAADQGDAAIQNELAWRLATDPDPKNRAGTNSVLYAEQAVAATSRTNDSYLDTLAAAYAAVGQFTKAVQVQQEAIALAQDQNQKLDYTLRLKCYQSNRPYRDHGLLAERAQELLDTGRFVEAEHAARECLLLREAEIPEDWRTFNTKSLLGGALLGQKKFAEAEASLLAGYEGLKARQARLPKHSPRFREALQRLLQFSEATSQPERAAEWRKKLAELDNAAK